MAFEKFPYTNFHGMNLDWILAKLKEIDENFNENLTQTVIDKINELVVISAYDPVTETLTIDFQIPTP